MSQRITEHPILGKPEKGELVEFLYDGKPLKGYEGEPIAAALKAAGVMVHRHTTKLDRPRGVFCAIGRCRLRDGSERAAKRAHLHHPS